jgi:hypothetical protein
VTDLADLPPPRKGAKAAYYPDPLRTGRARWWDGSRWTLQVGPRVTADAPMGKAIPPPVKVCPRCAAQSETFAGECPNCGRSYTLSSPWKIAAICVAALLLLIGGCGACAVIGINLADDELERHSITRGEFAEVQLGTPQAAVERTLGEPVTRERIGGRRCISYDDQDVGLLEGGFFQFCFENGLLASKDPY